MFRKLLFAMLVSATVASAQSLMPARQVQVRTNDFQKILSVTNLQQALDFVDDSLNPAASNIGVTTGSLTVVSGTNVQLAIQAVDGALSNLNTSVSNNSASLSAVYTNDYVVLPDRTGTVFSVTGTLHDVDSVLTSMRVPSRATFLQYESEFNDCQRVEPSAGDYSIVLSHGSTATTYRAFYTNGVVHTTSGSDMYWSTVSGGVYQVSAKLGYKILPTASGGANVNTVSAWLTDNRATTNASTSRRLGEYARVYNVYDASTNVITEYFNTVGLFDFTTNSVLRLELTVSGVATCYVFETTFDAVKISN